MLKKKKTPTRTGREKERERETEPSEERKKLVSCFLAKGSHVLLALCPTNYVAGLPLILEEALRQRSRERQAVEVGSC